MSWKNKVATKRNSYRFRQRVLLQTRFSIMKINKNLYLYHNEFTEESWNPRKFLEIKPLLTKLNTTQNNSNPKGLSLNPIILWVKNPKIIFSKKIRVISNNIHNTFKTLKAVLKAHRNCELRFLVYDRSAFNQKLKNTPQINLTNPRKAKQEHILPQMIFQLELIPWIQDLHLKQRMRHSIYKVEMACSNAHFNLIILINSICNLI